MAVRSVAGMVLVAMLAAACTAQTETPTTGAGASAASEPAATPTDAATASQGPQTAEAELAALLPDEIDGQEAFKLAVSGANLIAGSGAVTIEPGFQGVLESLGAQPEDVSFALASGVDAEGATIVIMAFRVLEADTSQLQAAFEGFWSTPDQPIDWQPDSRGGKSVVAGDDPDNPGNTISLYASGDIMFYVSAPSGELAAELLGPLP